LLPYRSARGASLLEGVFPKLLEIERVVFAAADFARYDRA